MSTITMMKLEDWTKLGEDDQLQVLQENRLDINAREKYGRTVNQIWEGDQGQYGRTALHFAANQGHLKCIQFLLDRGVNIEERDGFNRTALILAAEENHAACIQLLLEKGASVVDATGRYDTEEDAKVTALRMVTANHISNCSEPEKRTCDHIKCADILLSTGRCMTECTQISLDCSYNYQRLYMAEMFARHGFFPSIRFIKEDIEQSFTGKTFKLLFPLGLRLPKESCVYRPLPWRACLPNLMALVAGGVHYNVIITRTSNCVKFVKFLLHTESMPCSLPTISQFCACTNDNTDPMSSCWYLMLKYGASPHKPFLRHTPLYHAAAWGNMALAKLLLSLGANPRRKEPGEDRNPLDVAQERNISRMVDLFTGKEAPLDIPWDPSPVPCRKPNQPDRGLLIIPQNPRDLQHITRQAIRSRLLDVNVQNLFFQVHALAIPECLKNYLLFNVSLGDIIIENDIN